MFRLGEIRKARERRLFSGGYHEVIGADPNWHLPQFAEIGPVVKLELAQSVQADWSCPLREGFLTASTATFTGKCSRSQLWMPSF